MFARAFCGRVARKAETLLRTTQPEVGAGVAAAVGLAMVVLSRILGLDDVPDQFGRQVGYFYCLNWSVVYVLVFPITFYFILSTYQRLPRLFDDLNRHGMIRHRDTMEIPHPSKVSGVLAESHPYLTTLAVLAGFGISYAEVALENVLPLFGGSWDRSSLANDWGEAALIRGLDTLPYRIANALFDVAAFSMQAFALSVILVFFFWFFDLAHALPSKLNERQLVVTPDPRRNGDRRLGFDAFQRMLEPLLYAAIGTYAMCYFSRLQKLYFSTSTFKGIGEFILRDVGKVLQRPPDVTVLFAIKPEDVQAPPGIFAMLLTMAGIILIAIVAITLAWVLRGLATDGRDAMLDWLMDNPARELPGAGMPNRSAAQNRLAGMDIWPLGYPSFNTFAFTLLVALLSLISYRTLILACVYVISVIVYKYVLPGSKSNKRQQSGDGNDPATDAS